MVARVILNNKEQNIDKLFDYEIPERLSDKVKLGMRVAVPFGFSRRTVRGIVVEIEKESEYENLKEISSVIGHEPVCSPNILKLCLWVSRKYYCSLYRAIRLAAPPKMDSDMKEKTVNTARLSISRETAFELAETLRNSRATAQSKVVEALIMSDDLPLLKIVKEKGGTYDAVRALEKKGVLTVSSEKVERRVFDENKYSRTTAYVPTPEQRIVIEHLNECIDNQRRENILLRGVTGSGKTEVFLQAIERVIAKGKNAIMLVPEISLTPQTVQRFVGRFGNRVAVIHSALSDGERFDQWTKIKNNEVQVVVGARSAVFAPFERLGIIILDEEHESSYKSETAPRYHAVEVAQKRADTDGCVMLLASATPTVAEYYKAKSGEYRLFEMTKRYNENALPEVKVVDMRGELFENKNHSPISIYLQNEIKVNLEAGKKTILFLNRRGYSTFVSCRKCGEVIKCPDCDIALTYHKRVNSLSCHYCGYTQKNVTECPFCASPYVKYFGTGTQKIEEELRHLFPTASIFRMDTDTTSKKGGHERILDDFAKRGDILIGTQMVTKGLDFHDVTLVGVLAADTALAMDDFRANERSFSLFTQVCGRAGRGDVAGRAVIQTYQPQNSVIRFAKDHDYTAFYENEIIQRKRLNYPPFCDIICIMLTGDDEAEVVERAEEIASKVRGYAAKHTNLRDIVGPAPSPIAKIKNTYRYRILIKCTDTESADELFREIYSEHESKNRKTFLSIDVNPVNMY